MQAYWDRGSWTSHSRTRNFRPVAGRDRSRAVEERRPRCPALAGTRRVRSPRADGLRQPGPAVSSSCHSCSDRGRRRHRPDVGRTHAWRSSSSMRNSAATSRRSISTPPPSSSKQWPRRIGPPAHAQSLREILGVHLLAGSAGSRRSEAQLGAPLRRSATCAPGPGAACVPRVFRDRLRGAVVHGPARDCTEEIGSGGDTAFGRARRRARACPGRVLPKRDGNPERDGVGQDHRRVARSDAVGSVGDDRRGVARDRGRMAQVRQA